MKRSLHSTLTSALAVIGSLACVDGPTTSSPEDPGPDPESIVELRSPVRCDVRVDDASVTCRTSGAVVPAGVRLLVLGGQDQFIRLASSGAQYNDVSQIFSADVTVENLIGQLIGTPDGSTVTGVRVFFHQGPTPGEVTVANADDTGTFTASNQPYFQYDEILATNGTSAPKNWQWNVPTSVGSFSFEVLVDAAVEFPDGWVDVSPDAATVEVGSTQLLQATVRDVVGRVEVEPVTWLSSDGSIASVTPNGLVTGVIPGSVSVTASTSGAYAAGVSAIDVTPPSDLSVLSDEFNDAGSLAGWVLRSDFEGLVSDGTVEIADTVLRLIPIQGRNYFDADRGLSMFKFIDPTVTPRFVIETFASALAVGTESPPSSNFHAAGIVVFPDTANVTNWVVTNIGFQSGSIGLGFEDKSTIANNSDLDLYDTGDEFRGFVRLCVFDDSIAAYTRLPADANWTPRRRFEHTVGSAMMAGPMTNYFSASEVGMEGQFDYVRFMNIADKSACTDPIP